MSRHDRDEARTPEPMRDLSDEHIEASLREALQARADETQISGAGLSTIRDRVRRRTRMRIWRPVFAAAGAAAIIVGATVLPHIFSPDAADDGGAAASSASTHTSSGSAPQSSATGTPGSASAEAPSVKVAIGKSAPISTDTPTMYPTANTQQAADTLNGNEIYQPGLMTESPEQLASSFVTPATSGASGPVSTSAVTSSNSYVPDSDGAIVKVFGSSGNLVTVVFLKALNTGSHTAYVVMGASLPGGEAKSPLTIDAPQVDSQVVVGGKLRGDLRTGSATLSTAALDSQGNATVATTPTSVDVDSISSKETWNMTVEHAVKPHAAVAWTSDATGALTGLVGTTIG